MEPFHSFEPPQRIKRRGGIQSVAEVEENVERLPVGGTVGYAAPECGIAFDDAVLCYPENGGEQQPKNYNGIETFTGIAPIKGVSTGSECFIRGYDYEAEAERALEDNLDRDIEKVVADWAEANVDASTALSPLGAIAKVEADADAQYEGRPLIFVNRATAVFMRAKKAIFGDKDGNLWTINGTPVIASGQVPAGLIFATGAIKILKSSVITTRTISHITNREQALAEQVFAVLVDCEFLTGTGVLASE